MEFKICNKCKKELPLTSEYFQPRKDTPTGYRNDCKSCRTEYASQRNIKDKGARSRKRHEIYYAENKEMINEKSRQHYIKNKVKIGIIHRQYHEKNKVKYLAYSKKYRDINKEKIAITIKLWNLKNPDKARINSAKQLSLKHGLPATFTVDQWKQIKIYFNNKCAYCGKELPLTQDHFKALSEGGEYTINNIIPVCQSCNSSKSIKNFFDWYPNYEFYNKEREKSILTFLGYKNEISQQLRFL